MTLRSVAAISVLFFLSACGGSGGGGQTPIDTPPVNLAPTVNAGSDVTIRLPVDSVSLDGTVDDDGRPANSVSTAWTVQSGPAGATFGDPNAVDTTVTFAAEGTYVLELTADDTALQASDTVQITVEAAPVLSSIAVSPSAAALSTGQAQAFTVSGTDQYGNPITTTVTWSATGGTIDQSGNYTAGSTAGTFAVTATEGTVSGSATVTISDSPPVADAGGPYTGVQGASVALDGSGSTDPANDIASYEWDLDNDGVFDDASGVSATFAVAGSGVFTIGLRVTDADGAADSDTTTVTITNVAPTADPQSVSTAEDTPLPITLTGSDPGGDPLTFTIATQPTNGTLSGTAPNVTYTPNADFNGADSFAFTVNDGAVDSAAATASITVTAVNDVPTVSISSPADNSSFDAGELIAFQASATDVEDDDATLTAAIEWSSDVDGALGTGGSVDASTLTPGSHVVTAAVTDSGTESGSALVNVDVIDRAYWTFDEASGAAALDSFSDNDATIVGATRVAGVNGGGIEFNGVDDRVVVDDATALNIAGTEITLVAWINPANGGKNAGSRVISKRQDPVNGRDIFAMIVDDYRLRFRLDGGTSDGGQDMTSSHIVVLDEWVHVAMVYDGTDMRIYVNGQLDPATPLAKTDAIDASSRPVYVGKRENQNDGTSSQLEFVGIVDEAQIYGRALSAQEVSDLHAAFTPPAPTAGLSFTDISVSAGVADLPDGGHGIWFAEVDNDSLPDMYLTNNQENFADRPDKFYVNVTGVTFNEVGVARGIADIDGGSHGASWADLDNDGDFDLVNGTTWDNDNPSRGNPAPNNVFENDGTGFFTENTDPDIAAALTETRGFVAFDMDGDGDLDLYGISGEQDPGVKEAYLNDGGTFGFTPHVGGDLTAANIATTQGVTDTDYDGDGDVDIIAGNRGAGVTFLNPAEFAILNNDGSGNFSWVSPATLGITDVAGDGITSADIDNDGDLDLLLSSDTIGNLYRNDGNGLAYTKLASFSGVDGYMGGFADLDNDGDQDIVFAGDEKVYINNGAGIFSRGQSIPVSGIADPRAIAFADIEGDGDVDFAIAAKDSRTYLIQNNWDGAANNWLKVELIAANGQAGATGAKTFVYVAGQAGNNAFLVGMRESGSNQGYLSQDDPVLHFGLGSIDTTVDIVVEYVDGTPARTCTSVPANSRKLIDESVVDPCNP